MNDAILMATACSEKMHANDDASKLLGLEIMDSQPGCASIAMTVREEFTNGHDNCHGGLIFTLADTAFAHACNNSNQLTVASAASIEFLLPGRAGDRLTATASERSRGARIGVYDVEVSNQQGQIIALFRGNSYQIKGNLIASGDNE